MKKKFTLLTGCCLGVLLNLTAQSILPDFRFFTAEEINLKECAFEKEADAVVLFDYGFSYYNDNYQLVTDRHTRIKILTEKGLDAATIRIRYVTRDNFEFIRDIEALSYTPGEGTQPVYTSLDRKFIFTEKENEYYSSKKFAIPNVKAGSIIEYKYVSVMKHYGGLDSWTFQNELPTLKSCYLLQILPTAEFQYRVEKKRSYPIVIKPMPEVGRIYFEMNNIPGLKYEPYMDALKDYLQRVEFQFSGFVNRIGQKTEVYTTWKGLASELATDKSFGAALKKDLPNDATLKALVDAETSQEGKLKAIYNFVRNNFTWTGYYTKFVPDGLRKAWDKRAGHAAEINMILVSLLQSHKIEAYPLLVAERDFGKVDTSYPYLDRFNKTAVYAKADGRQFILDATDASNTPDLVPYPLLNTFAFVVDRKNFMLFRIKSGGQSFNYRVAGHARLDETGIVTGKAEITCTEYARQQLSVHIRKNEKNYINNYILAENQGMGLDSFQCENLAAEALPLVQKFTFSQDMNESGGYVLLNYNLFTGLQKTPFTKPERFTNVDFGFPVNKNIELNITLPPGSKPEKLPVSKKVESPRKDISASREITLENNILNIRISFRQTVTVITAAEYESLRKTYREIVEMLNEPVTIKVK
jgi:hypothetical protein